MTQPESVFFVPEEMIFRKGEKAEHIYLVADGLVEIFIRDEETDKKIVLAELSKNSIFGEMAIIDDNPRSAYAQAKTDVRCFKVDRKSFEEKVTNLEPFMRALFRVLVTNIRNSNARRISTNNYLEDLDK